MVFAAGAWEHRRGEGERERRRRQRRSSAWVNIEGQGCWASFPGEVAISSSPDASDSRDPGFHLDQVEGEPGAIGAGDGASPPPVIHRQEVTKPKDTEFMVHRGVACRLAGRERPVSVPPPATTL